MKRKFLFHSFIALLVVTVMTACEDKGKNEPSLPDADKPTTSSGFFVLNQGNYYAGIEGSLNFIEYDATDALENVFQTVNKRSLGATPQCGVAYGSKVYLGIYESSTIEIIDRTTFKSLKQIKLDGSKQPGTQPRSIVSDKGKIYISLFDGYVARLDTATLEIDATVEVGPNPETIVIRNGNIYVPNSNGMSMEGFGTTASIIDISSFSVTKTFTVPENPNRFYASDKGLFLLCLGNYYDVEAKIYKISGDLSYQEIGPATLAEICGDYLCFINDPFYGTGTADYKKYDIATGEISDWTIERPEYASDIYYDTVSEKIIINSLKYYGNIWPSYNLPGYVAVYDKAGNHLHDYSTGVGPAAIFKNAE